MQYNELEDKRLAWEMIKCDIRAKCVKIQRFRKKELNKREFDVKKKTGKS